jgi:hypothetical protein
VVVVVVVFIPAPVPVLQLPPIELKSMEKSELSEKEGRKSLCCVFATWRLPVHTQQRTKLVFFYV